MFKRNVGVTGFQIGHFIGIADGIAVTTGTPACKRLLDGTPGTLTNAASYDATAGVWKIDLAAADMDGALVGLSFTLAACLPISYTIKTNTKLVSELNDAAASPNVGAIGTEVWGGTYTRQINSVSSTISANVVQLDGLTEPVDNLVLSLGGTLASSVNLAAVKTVIDAIKLITDDIDVSAVTVTTSNNAGELTIKRSATFAATVSGLSIPADWLAVIWTLKGAASDDDEDAVIQVRVSNPAVLTDGLQRIEGGLPAGLSLTAAAGSATVDQTGGTAVLSLKAAATAVMEARGDAVWDLRVLRPPTGEAEELTTGTADIVYTVTHART